MKYSALTWVNPAIDDTLKQARQSLEQFVENPDDVSPLQDAVNCLHEIHGALSLIEITSAVILVNEMEGVTQALLGGMIKDREAAYDSLMRGMIQLPNYLTHLALGYPDIPVALLALINKLRILLQKQELSPNSLFSPDLHAVLPVNAAPVLPDPKFKDFATKFHAAYQRGLIFWLKGAAAKRMEGLKLMLSMLDRMTQITGKTPISGIWWVSAALLEAIAQKGLAPSDAVNNLFKQTDALMKQLVMRGTAALRMAPPHKVLNQLLFFAGHAKSAGPRITAVKKAFKLDSYLPNKAQLQAAQQIFSGPDIELMSNVVNAIKDDFARVEETLDIFMRADSPDVNDLAPLVEIMQTMAYTLRLLDLEVQCQSMLELAESVSAIVAGEKQHDMQELLVIANALLKIGAALETLGNRGIHARHQVQQERGLLETQFNAVMRVVVDEAKSELNETIQPIVSFIETGNSSDELMQIPDALKRIQGLLQIAAQERAFKLVKLCTGYIEDTIVKNATMPAEAEQKALADSIISLDFYLDTLAGNPMDGEKILDITQACLKILTPDKL